MRCPESCALALSAFLVGQIVQGAEQPADLVVLNGKIVTVNPHSSIVEAAAVREGRFVAVGANSKVVRTNRRLCAAGKIACSGRQNHHSRSLALSASPRSDHRGKRGDYPLQIKGNQPNLLKQAQGLDALKNTPFLPTPIRATDPSRSEASLPLPSNRSPQTFPTPGKEYRGRTITQASPLVRDARSVFQRQVTTRSRKTHS